jgi:hypothetical protein
MGDEPVIEFRRIYNVVQMVARNTEYVAGKPKTPTGPRAVEAAFAQPAGVDAGGQPPPHPDRKSVPVEANAVRQRHDGLIKAS